MTKQPVPDVTSIDLERVVKRDYSAGSQLEVMSILNQYGAESWQTEIVRVQMAVLKIADGELEEFKRQIEIAKCDYRDVIAAAEYPIYMQNYQKEISDEEKQNIIQRDWNVYQEWLQGKGSIK